MNNEAREHEVDYVTYCPKCKYFNYPIEAVPCCYCLDEPVATDSRKPVKFEQSEEPVNKVKKVIKKRVVNGKK